MSEVVEIVELVSASGVRVTVAAADVEHYLTVGFAEPQPEAEPESVEDAPKPARDGKGRSSK